MPIIICEDNSSHFRWFIYSCLQSFCCNLRLHICNKRVFYAKFTAQTLPVKCFKFPPFGWKFFPLKLVKINKTIFRGYRNMRLTGIILLMLVSLTSWGCFDVVLAVFFLFKRFFVVSSNWNRLERVFTMKCDCVCMMHCFSTRFN